MKHFGYAYHIDIVCFPVKSVKHHDFSIIPIDFVRTVFCFFYSFYRNVDNARSHMLCSVWIVFNSGYVEQIVFFGTFTLLLLRFLSSCSFNYLLIVKCVCVVFFCNYKFQIGSIFIHFVVIIYFLLLKLCIYVCSCGSGEFSSHFRRAFHLLRCFTIINVFPLLLILPLLSIKWFYFFFFSIFALFLVIFFSF